jgi:hypothetical protein
MVAVAVVVTVGGSYNYLSPSVDKELHSSSGAEALDSSPEKSNDIAVLVAVAACFGDTQLSSCFDIRRLDWWCCFDNLVDLCLDTLVDLCLDTLFDLRLDTLLDSCLDTLFDLCFDTLQLEMCSKVVTAESEHKELLCCCCHKMIVMRWGVELASAVGCSRRGRDSMNGGFLGMRTLPTVSASSRLCPGFLSPLYSRSQSIAVSAR